MKCTVFIKPRCSGKTFNAISTFLEDVNNNILIVDRQEKKEYILRVIRDFFGEKILKNYPERIKNNIIINPGSLKARRANKVVLDDHLMWSSTDKKNLQIYLPLVTQNVISFTSSKKLYDRSLFYKIKALKTEGKNSLDLTLEEKNSFIKDQIIELYNDIITDPNTELILTNTVIRDISKEDFLKLIPYYSIYRIISEFKLPEEILEEYFEFIPWRFYLSIHELSTDFLNKFGSDLKKLFGINYVYSDKNKLMQNNPCLDKLFYE